MDKEQIKALIIEMEVSALEQWNQGNPSGYLAIYAPQITYFDPMQEKRFDGFEKVEELYETLRGKGHVDRYEMIDPEVQLSDRTAVLTYNLKSYAGEKLWHWNCTEVYQLNEDDQWRIIHNHWSIVQPFAK